VQESFPGPGLTTLLVSSFSGGATGCCYAYAFLTINEADRTVLMTTLDVGGRTGQDDKGFFEASGRIRFGQWHFDGYGVEKDGAACNLYHAIAPWLPRFLVFDKGQWRLDGVGELAAFYKDRLAKLRGAAGAAAGPDADEAASRAVELAYTGIMAGMTRPAVLELLTRTLGPAQAVLAGPILDDVSQDIATATFIENKRLTPEHPEGLALRASVPVQKIWYAADAQTPADAPTPDAPFSDDAADQDGAQCGKRHTDPCDRAACLEGRLKYGDTRINARFRALRKSYPADRSQALKSDEIRWVKDYMRLQKSLQGPMNQGCAQKAEALGKVVEFLKQRTLYLLGLPDS
jgi:uncharacterized protein YecT (DUF1311 family)